MKRSKRTITVPDKFILPPDSSEGSDEEDDSDEDPDYNPQQVGVRRLERFLTASQQVGRFIIFLHIVLHRWQFLDFV